MAFFGVKSGEKIFSSLLRNTTFSSTSSAAKEKTREIGWFFLGGSIISTAVMLTLTQYQDSKTEPAILACSRPYFPGG